MLFNAVEFELRRSSLVLSLPWPLSCRPCMRIRREFGTSSAHLISLSGRRRGTEVGEIKDTQRANAVLSRLSKTGQLREAIQVLDCAESPHIQIHRQTYSALLQVRGALLSYLKILVILFIGVTDVELVSQKDQ